MAIALCEYSIVSETKFRQIMFASKYRYQNEVVTTCNHLKFFIAKDLIIYKKILFDSNLEFNIARNYWPIFPILRNTLSLVSRTLYLCSRCRMI